MKTALVLLASMVFALSACKEDKTQSEAPAAAPTMEEAPAEAPADGAPADPAAMPEETTSEEQ